MTESIDAHSIDALREEHAALEARMADPALHQDAGEARRVGRRYAELSAIVEAHTAWQRADEDLEAARELGAEDDQSLTDEDRLALAEEETSLAAAEQHARERLEDLLAPRDPDDARDVLMEIKAGAGGEESALFAGDLLRMYRLYAEKHGWVFEVLSDTDSDLGGIKDASISIRAKGDPSPADGVWAHLKYEGGVHRVQRVPVTESAGRIHTSAAGVLVMPEADDATDDELLADLITPNSLRVDVFRSSGPGGQSVNTTDSAVRITHLPTGIVVSCQNEKSQIQNREAAMRILKARLLEQVHAEADAEAADARRSQIRTVDRSERIRTYNFPENRVADHRTGYKASNLDAVLDGELDPVIESAVAADREAMLSSGSGEG